MVVRVAKKRELSLPSYASVPISALATIVEDLSSISISTIAMLITPECTIYILAASFQDGGIIRHAGTRSATQRVFE